VAAFLSWAVLFTGREPPPNTPKVIVEASSATTNEL
jgi:hypothetical protein